MTTAERLEEFFLEAAQATYAANTTADVRKGTLPGLPKSKVYQYRKGELLYVDTYFTNGDYSGGQTLIWLNDKPAWLHQYQGWCVGDDKLILAFLKRALFQSYRMGTFAGGRGPARYFEADHTHPQGG